MKIKVVYPDGKFSNFNLIDDDTGELVGTLCANSVSSNGVPKVEAMTRFQNAKFVLDGKSLKRLHREASDL